MPDPSPLRDWAASGAMALTGRPAGPPIAAPGRPAAAVRDALDRVRNHSPGVPLPGVGLLGERAAYSGFSRRGPWSCGGSFRMLPTADGHLGLSLARPSDLDLVPALVEHEVDDPWAAVTSWARRTSTAEAAARIALLGLPGGAVPGSAPADRPGVISTPLGRNVPSDAPLVIDFSSLWAGPLCAHLLGLTGARIVKIESTTRPDGARYGSRDFFGLLHAGHHERALDFTDTHDLDELRRLVASADLVIEASRPRALRRLGLIAEDVVAGGTTWLSITARGRDSDAIGFGDDIASRAGLTIRDGDDILPVGDALADPLSGVVAAATALDALRSDEARLIDVSMLHVSAESAVGDSEPHRVVQIDDTWWVETQDDRFPVADPAIRRWERS